MKRFYHGTRAELKPRDLIAPGKSADVSEQNGNCVYLTPDLDAAIWEAEVADGEGPSRVYIVEPIGRVEDDPDRTEQESKGIPSMTCRSREPLRVMGEITKWPLYHGTRADLKAGDLIGPGYVSNYGKRKKANYVYFAGTLNAATWGAELAAGEGPGRIYLVEPTGPVEDDPNLTDKKFRGNPTKSFRSRNPLRVTGEITDWKGHSPEALQAMKENLKRLDELGVEADD
jgi:hypothetical protein